jgi:halocyanin-like protein
MHDSTRRSFLRTAGAAAVVGVAGCSGDGDGGGSEYPAIDEWLTETEIGGADDTYNSSVLGRRDRDTLTIDVGASGNTGNFAYDPSAVLVSTGTEIEWSWTGEGNPHNVEAEPDDQIGESDYEFSSGEAEGGSGVKFTYTMDEAGIALYHCEPHLSLGMKGGIAVE